MQRELLLLQKQVEMITADKMDAEEEEEKKKQEEDKRMTRHLQKCESQITAVKDAMNSIMSMTKETHDDVQKTKDLISSIQNESISPKGNGSFQSRFNLDDYEDCEIFEEDNTGAAERACPEDQNDGGEDECVSKKTIINSLDYVITTEDLGEEEEGAGQWKSLK